jgi:hypothetical protein
LLLLLLLTSLCVVSGCLLRTQRRMQVFLWWSGLAAARPSATVSWQSRFGMYE